MPTRYVTMPVTGWLLTDNPESTPKDVFERHDVVIHVFALGGGLVVKNRSGNAVDVRDHANAIRDAWMPFMSESERTKLRIEMLERELKSARDARDNWSATHNDFVRRVQDALGTNSTGDAPADIRTMRDRIDARVLELSRAVGERQREIEKLRAQVEGERQRTHRMRGILNALWSAGRIAVQQEFAEIKDPDRIARQFIADISMNAEPVERASAIDGWAPAWAERIVKLLSALGRACNVSRVTLTYEPGHELPWVAASPGELTRRVERARSVEGAAELLEEGLRRDVQAAIDKQRATLDELATALRATSSVG